MIVASGRFYSARTLGQRSPGRRVLDRDVAKDASSPIVSLSVSEELWRKRGPSSLTLRVAMRNDTIKARRPEHDSSQNPHFTPLASVLMHPGSNKRKF